MNKINTTLYKMIKEEEYIKNVREITENIFKYEKENTRSVEEEREKWNKIKKYREKTIKYIKREISKSTRRQVLYVVLNNYIKVFRDHDFSEEDDVIEVNHPLLDEIIEITKVEEYIKDLYFKDSRASLIILYYILQREITWGLEEYINNIKPEGLIRHEFFYIYEYNDKYKDMLIKRLKEYLKKNSINEKQYKVLYGSLRECLILYEGEEYEEEIKEMLNIIKERREGGRGINGWPR